MQKKLMLLLVIKGNGDVAFNECSKRLSDPWLIEDILWNNTVTTVITDIKNNNHVIKWFYETNNLPGLPLFEAGSLLFYQEVLR